MKKSDNIKIYYVDSSYIDYLRKYDSKVPFNKGKSRPYVGIVYKYNNQNYFAPLSSPKPKHLKLKDDAIDIFKIDSGKLGIININNMIPVANDCLAEVLPLLKDGKYKNLIQNQLTFINKPDNKIKLLSKVYYFQDKYRNGFLDKKVLNRTCNFNILEEKCNEWNEKYSIYTIA